MRPLEGGDGLGARWAWRGLQEAEAEQKGGSSGHRRPPAALTGWAGPRSGRARAASAPRPRPRLRRRPSVPARAARPCARPGGSLDLGPPDASRRSGSCAPRGAPVWPDPCRRFLKQATGTRCELFSLPRRRGPFFPSREGQCSEKSSRWEWPALQ